MLNIVVYLRVHKHICLVLKTDSKITVPQPVSQAKLLDNREVGNQHEFSIDIITAILILELFYLLFLNIYFVFQIVYFLDRWNIVQIANVFLIQLHFLHFLYVVFGYINEFVLI